MDLVEYAELLCCPRCRSDVDFGTVPRCTSEQCNFAQQGFPVVRDQPVLIDFANSIFDRDGYLCHDGAVLPRDPAGRTLKSRFRKWVSGPENAAAASCASDLCTRLRDQARPFVLILGGGEIGSGASSLYENSHLSVLGTDVYASPYTSIIADAHCIPLKDCSVDAVWIQAVLEHVLEPHRVAAEIHRVLKPRGIVFANTPFMQQVHERGYDFTRFTLSGHRWLFREFDELRSGIVGGAGSSTIWSIRYLVRALTGSDRWGTIAAMCFSWLRHLDGIGSRQRHFDAACGVYFFGIKSEKSLPPKSMVAYYDAQV